MLSMHELSLPEPMLSLSMLILATYSVADIYHRSKPKSKLTSPNFNMLTFCGFGRFWLILAKCSRPTQAAVSPTELGGVETPQTAAVAKGGYPPRRRRYTETSRGGLTLGGGG